MASMRRLLDHLSAALVAVFLTQAAPCFSAGAWVRASITTHQNPVVVRAMQDGEKATPSVTLTEGGASFGFRFTLACPSHGAGARCPHGIGARYTWTLPPELVEPGAKAKARISMANQGTTLDFGYAALAMVSTSEPAISIWDSGRGIGSVGADVKTFLNLKTSLDQDVLIPFPEDKGIGHGVFTVYFAAYLHGNQAQCNTSGYVAARYEWRENPDRGSNRTAPPSTTGGNPPPNSPDCSQSPDQKLQEIFRRYYKQIPKGRYGSGILVNLRDLWDRSLGAFTCGGYQNQILNFFDRLRGSKNPKERCLFDDFDYGPIEIGVGLHQAVVIYRKGSDWKWTGMVLDPWFNQTPEVYSIAAWQWKSCMTMGSAGGCTVNGASWLGGYSKQYPTTGGPYPGDGGGPPPRPRTKPGRVTVNCPLIPYLIDEQGRVSGYRQNQELRQIPDVDFMTCVLEDGTPWTEFEFSPRKGLRLCMEGSGQGQAVIIGTMDLLKPAGSRDVWHYRMTVKKGESFSLPVATPRSPMATPKGTVSASTFTQADVEPLAVRLKPTSATAPPQPTAQLPPKAPAQANTRMYRHPEGAYHVTISTEWSLMERTPKADLDRIIRNPDRDNCAVYFGRDHEDASNKGIDASLDAAATRLSSNGPSRTERLTIGTARGVLVSVFDSKDNCMLWHLCLGYQNRIYYIGVEALPGTGQRELPPRIRELLQGLVMER